MIPKTHITGAEPAEDAGIARLSTRLSRDIVDVAGFLDAVDGQAGTQLELLVRARDGADRIAAANEGVRQAAEAAGRETARILETAESSLGILRAAGTRTQSVAAWVEDLDSRMSQLEERLTLVTRSNEEILAIARQVNILAINAKIEAARAGDYGKGFAVVADAINALSRKTSIAAEEITGSIGELSNSLGTLKSEAADISRDAAAVRKGSAEADAALSEIAGGLAAAAAGAEEISSQSAKVESAGEVFGPAFTDMGGALETTVANIAWCRDRVHALIETSEDLVQRSISAGGASEDRVFIAQVCAAAERIGQAFEEALDQRAITEEALFDTDYRPIPNSDPAQHMTRFVTLTDRLLPPLQEEVLASDPMITFCAAVDRNGYLPTHNKKFSQPQGRDPVWNAANCRNRRIFNDRVGLKSGRNTKPFLVQVYRRDMGGGNFVLMKDVSAPITVRGRHWGGLRLAYAIKD